MTTRSKKSFLFFIALVLLQCLVLYRTTTLTSVGEHSFDIPIFNLSLPGGIFILHYFISFLITFVLVFIFPTYVNRKKGMAIIVLLSVCFRLAVFSLEPSDDANRYLWEGKLVASGINPYHHAPQTFKNKGIAVSDPYFSKINHPDVSAAYPPVALFIFAGISKISHSYIGIKSAIILFDLLTVFVLLRLLLQRRSDIRWALFYAANPLIIFAFAGHAHFDVIMIFCLLLALYFHRKSAWIPMFIFLGLSFQIKYFGILAAPFLINRRNISLSWILPVIMTLPYLPLINGGIHPLISGIFKFGSAYAFNGPIHSIFRAFFSEIPPATQLTSVLFIVWILLLCGLRSSSRFKHHFSDPDMGIFYVLGGFLILSPTIHFWYISWILPFALIRKSFAWIILSFFMGFYFVVMGVNFYTGVWVLPPLYQYLIWLLFFIFLIVEGFYVFKRLIHNTKATYPETIGVIIPCLNEGTQIEKCIEQIKNDTCVTEIIIVDAGSHDDTVILAKSQGAKVISHLNPPEQGGGRGGQIFAGLKVMTSDITAIVHADVLVEPDTFTRILDLMQNSHDTIGGSFGCHFDARTLKMWFIEALNDVRAGFLGISFGDQIQFFRTSAIQESNIFPDIPLMEDVELSLRLKSFGLQDHLFGSALVSDRLWEKKGFINSIWVVTQVTKYIFTRLFKTPDTLRLFHDYYGTGKGRSK